MESLSVSQCADISCVASHSIFPEITRRRSIMPVDAMAALALLKELRALSADEHGAQRLAWSPMWLKAREWFQSKLTDLPVEHHYDAAGNSWTTLRGDSEKALILGSHLDSVPNGGW